MTDYRTEFPDFEPADMPAVPAGFMDSSWRFNVCPTFTSDPLGLNLWIDYLNPADREHQGWLRFRLESQSAGIETTEFYLETDDFAEVLAAIDARTLALEAKG